MKVRVKEYFQHRHLKLSAFSVAQNHGGRKLRPAFTGSMLVLCLIGSAAAQQGRSLSDQEASKIAEGLTATYVATWNAGDAEALSKLFSANRYLPALGPIWDSQEAIKNGVAARIKTMKLTEKLLEAHAAGDAVWATGEWTLAPADGQPITGRYAWVAVPEGNNWRLRMQISNVIPSALEIDSPGRRGVTAKPSHGRA